MLILTRRVGESLEIGQEGDVLREAVQVTVIGIKGNQVRIGVRAAPDIRVDREEIRRRIENEEKAAGRPVVRISDAALKVYSEM